MKVKDVRLHLLEDDFNQRIVLLNQDNVGIGFICWGRDICTKAQAWAIANRLCDRFNAGQEGK